MTHRRRPGTSLVEVLVALGLLAVALGALLPLLTTSRRTRTHAHHLAVATTLLEALAAEASRVPHRFRATPAPVPLAAHPAAAALSLGLDPREAWRPYRLSVAPAPGGLRLRLDWREGHASRHQEVIAHAS